MSIQTYIYYYCFAAIIRLKNISVTIKLHINIRTKQARTHRRHSFSDTKLLHTVWEWTFCLNDYCDQSLMLKHKCSKLRLVSRAPVPNVKSVASKLIFCVGCIEIKYKQPMKNVRNYWCRDKLMQKMCCFSQWHCIVPFFTDEKPFLNVVFKWPNRLSSLISFGGLK